MGLGKLFTTRAAFEDAVQQEACDLGSRANRLFSDGSVTDRRVSSDVVTSSAHNLPSRLKSQMLLFQTNDGSVAELGSH